MLKCKVCGTANDSHATVCLSCGASLIEKEKKNSSTGNTENEIFSSKNSEQVNFSDSSNEIYSSKSSYNEAQQRKLFEKIRRQEEAIGDVFDAEPPKKSEPVVINRQPTHDENRTQGTGHSPKPNKIPQRIIESVDKQVLQQKMKPTTKPSADIADDDEKVELTSSEVIERIQEKHEQTMQLRKLQAEKQRQKKLADSQSAKAQQIKKQKKSQAKLSESNTVGKDKQKSTREAIQLGSASNKTVSKPMLKTELTENSTPVKKLSKGVKNASTADDISKTKKKIVKKPVKSVSDGNTVKKKTVASTSVQSAESIPARKSMAQPKDVAKSDNSSAEGNTVKKKTGASAAVKSSE
ncbi:MAG: hypothetical protein K2M82_03835, partial [Lachnospiraceae bacterium]|nr:hypothetical protein [Lachnospiraceae bacterium]